MCLIHAVRLHVMTFLGLMIQDWVRPSWTVQPEWEMFEGHQQYAGPFLIDSIEFWWPLGTGLLEKT